MPGIIGAVIFGLFAVETITFIALAGAIGFLTSLMLCALTSFCGIWLVRTQGFETVFRLMQSGTLEAGDIKNGLFLMLAGLLFLFPGFVTDAAGFIILIPPVRALLFRRASAAFVQKAPGCDPADGVIEGVYEVVPDEKKHIDHGP